MKYLIPVLGIVGMMYSCSINSSNSENNSDHLIVASDTANIRYQCPMKCEGDTSYTTSGSCPVCGMELQLVESM